MQTRRTYQLVLTETKIYGDGVGLDKGATLEGRVIVIS